MILIGYKPGSRVIYLVITYNFFYNLPKLYVVYFRRRKGLRISRRDFRGDIYITTPKIRLKSLKFYSKTKRGRSIKDTIRLAFKV